MTPELALSLAVLALVDSSSIGTLLIPLFFLVAPGRLRAGRVVLYLGTIAAFYFAIGLALTAGASALIADAAAFFATPAARWAQLVAGAGLFALSFFLGGPKTKGTRAKGGEPKGDRADAASARRGRIAAWRDRALGDGPPLVVVALALGAGVVELATMLPYLGAVGLLTAADLPAAVWIAALAGYCAIMIAPALVLLAGRIAARRIVEPPLARFAAWLERTSGETTAWIVGIVGFLLARDAASNLGIWSVLDDLAG